MVVYLLRAVEFLHSYHCIHSQLGTSRLPILALTRAADIKLGNIQLMLLDNEQEILTAFVAEEKTSPSPSKATPEGFVICASREMRQDKLSIPILCDLGAAQYDHLCYNGLVQL